MSISFQHYGQHSGSRLFFVVHGMEHTAANLAQVKETIADAFPADDILMVTYPAGRWSNLNPIELAKQCVARIQFEFEAHTAGGYKDLVLVGHSLGALFARKICLLAHGICSDYAGELAVKPAPRKWANRITRLVLLAGMSRGWRLWPRNRYTPINRWLARACQYWLASSLGLGKLVRSAHRGSPFIVNLRLDWLALSNRDYPNQTPPEVVVQLAGMHDTVVHPTDHIDLQAGRNFRYYEIPGTSHHAMVRFDDPQYGAQRKRVFLYALQTPVPDFEGGLIPQTESPDESVAQIILTTHGIRDYGKWQEDLRDDLIAEARKRNLSIATSISNYDYLPLIPFLFGWGRSVHTERLMDRYAEVRSQYPKAKCSFAGHSNGTYLVASALRRYQASSFERVAFMGSIVQRNFPWLSQFKHRITELRNYVASSDAVVAVFPSLFEMIRQVPLMSGFPLNRDFGSAGHTGFTQLSENVRNVSYISGGHGAALEPRHRQALVSFLLGDAGEHRIAPELVGNQSEGVVLAHKACLLIWLFMLAAALGLLIAAVFFNLWLAQHWPSVPSWPVPVALAVLYGFILFRW